MLCLRWLNLLTCRRQRDGLREIERLLDLHAAAGSPIPSSASNLDFSNAKNDQGIVNGNSAAGLRHSPPALRESAPLSGSQGAAIVVDDDSDVGVAPTEKSPSTHISRQLHDQCPSCKSKPNHPSVLCPVIQAGPGSTKRRVQVPSFCVHGILTLSQCCRTVLP